MRTIHQARRNQKKEGSDGKTQANQVCWSRLEEYAMFDDIHWPKAAGPSVPLNGAQQLLGNGANNHSDFMLKPRQVILRTGSLDKTSKPNRRSGGTLAKSNSLPPIFNSRVTSKLGAKILTDPRRLTGHEVLQMGKKANVSAIGLQRQQTFMWRHRDCTQLDNTVDLICHSLMTLTVAQNTPEPGIRIPNPTDVDQPAKISRLEENKPNAKDSGVIRDGITDSRSIEKPKRPNEELSDSVIDTVETHSSHRNNTDKTGRGERNTVQDKEDDEEEEEEGFYTRQRIIEWIIRVNTCLFSPSKDEFNKEVLKEEDVDTIKIVHGQD